MKLPIFVYYTMLDIAQLCKTNYHSRNYFKLIEQHGTLKVQIYMSTIISKSVINNLAVTFFQYVFGAKFFFNGNINVLFLQLLS